MEPFIGQIMMFGGNFAPKYWAFCDGQILSISDHQALYSLLGNAYGGDGRTTFALPDLRGRVTVHPGSGPGLTTKKLGQSDGLEATVININNMPNHSHNASFTQTSGEVSAVGSIPVNNEDGNADSSDPSSGVFAYASGDMYTSEPANANNPGNISVTGSAKVTGNVVVDPQGNQEPFNNMQPFLAINYIIALEGIYPSRS
ncbi:microcystin-dependent protein [Wenyingzhuangia heitensis]|uniref:Microcystin-dependent protein n=1 Tax=Wenyingzhuangia heitensis TaxID=1487859 RepID=A0ABX0U7W2_9FLAO|nr:tail fiber protein [Wenyingzhuangia heitensis]NIJ44045.1 microcystin-dependent protein [Wenyingzhuangia heitensis]